MPNTIQALLFPQCQPIPYIHNFFKMSVQKWLSVFLTMVRLGSVDHWLSRCKYDYWNRKQLLLWNAPQSRGVERLLDDESLAWKYLTLSLKSPLCRSISLYIYIYIYKLISLWVPNTMQALLFPQCQPIPYIHLRASHIFLKMSVQKRLSVLLTVVRLRHVDQWLSSCKYDS